MFETIKKKMANILQTIRTRRNREKLRARKAIQRRTERHSPPVDLEEQRAEGEGMIPR